MANVPESAEPKGRQEPPAGLGGISRRTSLAALAMSIAAPGRASATTASGIGPGAESGAGLGQVRTLSDALTARERADAASGSPAINLTAKINAFLAEHPHVEIPAGVFLVDHLDIPASLLSLRAQGKSTLTFQRRPGAAGAMVRCSGERNTHAVIEGLYLTGNGEARETCGFDLTGFSYATFINCRARSFRLDGWYAKGLITPVNRQMSNNTFINCSGNNNGRDGFRAVGQGPLYHENTANIFTGGEFSGNSGFGISGDVCDSTQFYGVTCQGNRSGDVWFNSRYCVFRGYVESGAKSIRMGPLSRGCDVALRSPYPWWNTFVDEGTANTLSVMGEVEPERHLFSNPYFTGWRGAAPPAVAPNGAPALSSYADPSSPFGAGLQMRISADFQGLVFQLLASSAEIAGEWATLILEVDTSGVVDPLEMRVYARDGMTPNAVEGEFAVEPLAMTLKGRFRTLVHDIRFAAVVIGTPTVIWYPAFSGVRKGGNLVRIRSARIVMGQSRRAGWPLVDLAQSFHATPG